MRLAMPDRACVGIDVEGAQTGTKTSYDGRIITTDNPQHIRALRELGCFPVNIGGRSTKGYRCGCGFSSHFAVCGRCGDTCQREP